MQTNYRLLFLLLCSLNYYPGMAQLPFTQHPAPPGLNPSSLRMNDLQVDANNRKWIAFANAGLGMYDGSAWTMYDSTNGNLPTDSVICVAFDNSGNVWIGTKQGAVNKSGSTFTVYNAGNSGLPSNTITAIYTDGAVTWFGTKTGLVAFDGTNWTVFNTGNSGLANDSITVLEKSASGELWVGTRNGLSLYDSGSWTNFTTINSVIKRYISDLEIDNIGRVWVSGGIVNGAQIITNIGIFFISNNQVNPFETEAYFFDVPFSYVQGTGLAKDLNGNIVFRVMLNSPTNGRGIFRVTGGNTEFFAFDDAVNYGFSSAGSIMKIDNNGTFWMTPRYRFFFYSMDFGGYVQPFDGINLFNHRTLDINEVKAGINVRGDMHWDLSNASYEVPKGSGKHSVFSSAFWIGGIDTGGQLHLAAQTYRQTGNDYWPGPINGISIPFDSASCLQFDRIWKVDKWRIEEFKNEFLAGNVTNGTYPVPDEIMTWPAIGNGVVTDHLAPFIDYNADGIYDFMDGDYPDIKGDQMLFHVFNDSLAAHSETNGEAMGVEVHASAYAFYCPAIADSNQAINWTTFYNYRIINKSIYDYDSVYMGIFCDIDLGNAADDYVGCDSALAAGFGYNGDNNDEGSPGYGLNPPMQNVMILQGTLADPSDGVDNDLDGIIDEPGERTTMNHFQYYNGTNNSPTGNPNGALHFYNYMRSIWLDGMHVTYGDDGRNPSNAPSNFMFSGTPYDLATWNEYSAGNPPEDRRMLVSSGAFSLDAGDTATLDFAYVFTWDSLNPNGILTSVARNVADLQRVRQWYNSNTFPSCQVYSVGMPELHASDSFSLFPNPATSELYIKTTGSIKELNYSVYNLLGEIILSGKLFSNKIDISTLTDQVYLLRLYTNSENRHLKFVKSSVK